MSKKRNKKIRNDLPNIPQPELMWNQKEMPKWAICGMLLVSFLAYGGMLYVAVTK